MIYKSIQNVYRRFINSFNTIESSTKKIIYSTLVILPLIFNNSPSALYAKTFEKYVEELNTTSIKRYSLSLSPHFNVSCITQDVFYQKGNRVIYTRYDCISDTKKLPNGDKIQDNNFPAIVIVYNGEKFYNNLRKYSHTSEFKTQIAPAIWLFLDGVEHTKDDKVFLKYYYKNKLIFSTDLFLMSFPDNFIKEYLRYGDFIGGHIEKDLSGKLFSYINLGDFILSEKKNNVFLLGKKDLYFYRYLRELGYDDVGILPLESQKRKEMDVIFITYANDLIKRWNMNKCVVKKYRTFFNYFRKDKHSRTTNIYFFRSSNKTLSCPIFYFEILPFHFNFDGIEASNEDYNSSIVPLYDTFLPVVPFPNQELLDLYVPNTYNELKQLGKKFPLYMQLYEKLNKELGAFVFLNMKKGYKNKEESYNFLLSRKEEIGNKCFRGAAVMNVIRVLDFPSPYILDNGSIRRGDEIYFMLYKSKDSSSKGDENIKTKPILFIIKEASNTQFEDIMRNIRRYGSFAKDTLQDIGGMLWDYIKDKLKKNSKRK